VAVPLLDGGEVRAVLALALSPWPGDEGGGAAAGVATRSAGATAIRGGLDMLHDVEMEVSAELGRTRMSVRELLSLTPGAIVELDRAAGSPADLLVNGRLIAKGEVVVIDENFGIRITEIVSPGSERE
jgi:flagellar motor switch protein FliN/FliY